MDFIFQSIGFCGTIFDLISFSMMKFRKWNHEDLYYNLFNIIGSTLLLIDAVYFKNIAFCILNIVWTIISFRDIVKLYRK